MSGISIQGFVRRSSQLTMLLMADENDFRLLLQILNAAPPPPHEKAMLAALRYVRKTYADDRRKIKTLSVLHPCRVSSTIALIELKNGRYSGGYFDVTDFLVALQHDVEEDIPASRLQAAKPEFDALLNELNEEQRWYMRERIHALTRPPGISYFDYLCSLLDTDNFCVNLVRIKTADKLDGVLDLHLMAPTVSNLDFYLTIFEILCVPTYRGLPKMPEPPVGRKQVELFVSNLAKALLWISLVRQTESAMRDLVVRELIDLLIEGAIRQTEVILLSYLMARIPFASEQHGAIKTGFEYCQDPAAVMCVTPRDRGHLLDGSLLEDLALQADDKTRKRRITELYDDPTRFTALLFVMLSVLRCCMDGSFFVKGITKGGIRVP